jgi:hypothetical protein
LPLLFTPFCQLVIAISTRSYNADLPSPPPIARTNDDNDEDNDDKSDDDDEKALVAAADPFGTIHNNFVTTMSASNRLVSVSNGSYITALHLVQSLFKGTLLSKKIGLHEPLVLPCSEGEKLIKKDMTKQSCAMISNVIKNISLGTVRAPRQSKTQKQNNKQAKYTRQNSIVSVSSHHLTTPRICPFLPLACALCFL